MSQNAIKYLEENKDKFSKEVLLAELKKAGYPENDIFLSAEEVYEKTEYKSTDFFDFVSFRRYQNSSEKILDFLLGLLAPWIIGSIILFIEEDFIFLSLFVYLFILLYFRKRRVYIFKGLLWDLYISIIGFIVFWIILSTFFF